jgi:segregation and condensation protein B
MNNLSQIEALLFVSGDEGISVKNMSIITGFDRSAIQGLLEELVLKYDTDLSSALQIRESDDVYRLVTKPELGGTVKQYFDSPVNATLSQAQLETLVYLSLISNQLHVLKLIQFVVCNPQELYRS